MNSQVSISADKLLFYRIVALWAVCEGMLGGIIHGFNLPGTGLLVSSGSVICISLLAWYFPSKGIILKATIIVAIFKMLLSPHSPPTAYIAVFFQGLLGELLFINKRTFKASCILLATLSLVESAIQRILVLTLIYGSTFWKATDQFIAKLTGSKHITSYSWYIAIAYVLLHLIVGVFVGRFASSLPNSITAKQFAEPDLSVEISVAKRKGKKLGLLMVWATLFALYLQSEFKIGHPLLPASDIIQIIIRSFLVVLLWYFIVSPALSFWLNNWLRHKQYKLKDDVEAVVTLIPSTQHLLAQSWKSSAEQKGFKRLGNFTKQALARTISK